MFRTLSDRNLPVSQRVASNLVASNRANSDMSGLTLIELLMVVMIIGLISSFAATRLDSVVRWKQESEIRKFINTWQFLYSEAFGQGQTYQLIIDLDQENYYVRREVPLEEGEARDVDYLANLRTKSEKARRAADKSEKLQTLEEELDEEQARQSEPLDELFYKRRFSDPEGGTKLARPLDYPSLAEEQQLIEGLEFRDVVIGGEMTSEGIASIRMSPHGASEFAVVHLIAEEQVYTVVVQPATGNVSLHYGDQDFKYDARKGGYEQP